jgi:methionyl-tRNA synthetase
LPYRDWWVNSGQRVHVIGKGITRFHAVYWLALLLSAGQPLPSAIYVHEYLSADGAKLSKRAGHAVSPYDLAGRFGTDAVRWWLLARFDFRAATGAIWSVVQAGNRLVETQRP